MLIEDTRLALERQSRMYIQRIFSSVMADRWDAVFSVYQEACGHSDWMAVAVFAGLPNTVKEKIREHEHETRRPDRG